MTSSISQAVTAIDSGDLVVYPTDTVYGLGGDALDGDAVERVFAAKGRARSKPISLAVSDRSDAEEIVTVDAATASFMEEFLPGAVTVICETTPQIPSTLVAGRDRVGVRIPDHDLAREFAARAGPITATSANQSGEPEVRRIDQLDPDIETASAVVLDGGTTPGGVSTVVDVERNVIHRAGRNADRVRDWLIDHHNTPPADDLPD